MTEEYDYSHEKKQTTISESIMYTLVGIGVIATDYTIKAVTFLPRKGLEWLADRPLKIFRGYNED